MCGRCLLAVYSPVEPPGAARANTPGGNAFQRGAGRGWSSSVSTRGRHDVRGDATAAFIARRTTPVDDIRSGQVVMRRE